MNMLILTALMVGLGNLPLTASCPSGMFGVGGSSQCFQFIQESHTWEAGWGRCSQEGLVLARPDDSIAVPLRQYILENFGDYVWPWVSARGTGSGWSWRRSGGDDGAGGAGAVGADGGGGGGRSMVPRELVHPDRRSRDGTSVCLDLAASELAVTGAPTAPYGVGRCTATRPVLCQVAEEAVWGPWTSWSPCSSSCGKREVSQRTRTCSPGASAGCQGNGEETQTCVYVPCPINADKEWCEMAADDACKDPIALKDCPHKCSPKDKEWCKLILADKCTTPLAVKDCPEKCS